MRIRGLTTLALALALGMVILTPAAAWAPPPPPLTLTYNPATGNYYGLTDFMSWHEAEAYAQTLGGHLVTLNDRDEELWVKDTFGTETQYWIGFNDIDSEGTWVWSSGEPVTYTNWDPYEPNNCCDCPDPSLPPICEDAAVMNWPSPDIGGHDSWNDLHPAGYAPAVIEIPGVQTGPPWNPGAQMSGRCLVLVWFDEVHVAADTDADVDDWVMTGAMRFYDPNPKVDREVAVIGDASFMADAGETVTLERQWRTQQWSAFDGEIRLDDIAILVTERDRFDPDDRGSIASAPGVVFRCGDTLAVTANVAVDPGVGRRFAASGDTQGMVTVEMTVTTVRVARALPPPCDSD